MFLKEHGNNKKNSGRGNYLKRVYDFNRIYEEILHSNMNDDEKSMKFAELMTLMEKEFKIPFLKDNEWESKNKAIIALYRKISMSRKLD